MRADSSKSSENRVVFSRLCSKARVRLYRDCAATAFTVSIGGFMVLILHRPTACVYLIEAYTTVIYPYLKDNFPLWIGDREKENNTQSCEKINRLVVEYFYRSVQDLAFLSTALINASEFSCVF